MHDYVVIGLLMFSSFIAGILFIALIGVYWGEKENG